MLIAAIMAEEATVISKLRALVAKGLRRSIGGIRISTFYA